MSANLRLLESQSSHRDPRMSPGTLSELQSVVSDGPTDALERLSVPAAAYLDPTPLQRATRVGWQLGTAAVDLTFGTHWAINQRLQSNSRLRRLKRENIDLTRLLAGDPWLSRASPVTLLNARQNAHAVQALNRHGYHAARVRKYCYGDAVVVGGLPFGAGLTIGPQIGGGITTALTAASVPLLWIGGPILAAAALGVGVHEGVRYRRARRLQRNAGTLTRHAVMGNEAGVQSLLAARLRGKRVHAATKSVSVIGCGISAPLLAVGLVPGLVVLTPAAAVFTWAWYYHHNNLRYRPSLTAAERIMLGTEHDIANRVDLAHRARSSLKALKAQKRLLYPRGAQSIMGLRETAKSIAWIRRKWSGVPKHYPSSRETVFKFLQALAGHEVAFVRHQEVLQHHALAALHTSGADAQHMAVRQGELSRQRDALSRWLADRTEECGVLNGYAQAPEAPAVAKHFLTFLHRYRLLDAFTRDAVLRNASVKHHFLERGAIVHANNSFHFELAHVAQRLDAHAEAPSRDTMLLSRELCDVAERWLFTKEKKRLTFFERELLDILAYRLDGPNHRDFPSEGAARPAFRRWLPPTEK